MEKPIIGISCHALDESIPRFAVSQSYVKAIAEAGGTPICVPLGLDGDSLRQVYSMLDGLLLPGGDDVHPARYGHEPHPKLGSFHDDRDELELTLAQWALRDNVPLLGICRGVQVLAVAAGGTLYQDIPSQIAQFLSHDVREFGRDYLSHEIDIEPDSHLARAIGKQRTHVNSFHHQSVWTVPPAFRVTARSDDGVIEAIESETSRWAVGIQCHPEALWSASAPEFSGLFRTFVEQASVGISALSVS